MILLTSCYFLFYRQPVVLVSLTPAKIGVKLPQVVFVWPPEGAACKLNSVVVFECGLNAESSMCYANG
mgnify:CR=1 FL=1